MRDVGVVLDTAVHDIDTARWLFSEEPRLVFARTGRLTGGQEDFAAIILGFSRDRTAFIASNWITPKKVRTLTAVCTDGIITIDFITQEVRVEGEEGVFIPRREWAEPLKLELKNFLDAVEGRCEPLVKGEDAVKTSRVAEAALVSSKTGSPIWLESM